MSWESVLKSVSEIIDIDCIIIGTVLNKTLSRTETIYTHGLRLSSALKKTVISKQVIIRY